MAASTLRFILELMLHPQRLECLQQQHSADTAMPDVTRVMAAIDSAVINPAQRPAATSLEQRLAFESLGIIAHHYQMKNLSGSVKAPLFAFLQQQQQQWQQAQASAH